MNSINMWGKNHKSKGTKREEISKGSKKLSVSTFAVKRTEEKQWFTAKQREQVPAR